MDKITINLATGRYIKTAYPLIVAVTAAAFALLLSVNSIYGYSIDSKREALLSTRVAAYEQKYGEVKVSDAGGSRVSNEEINRLGGEAEIINRAIKAETFSWTTLLSALETTVPKDVSIAQVTPSFKDGNIAILGMAKTKQRMLDFVEKMSQSGSFDDVFLLGHSEGNKSGLQGAERVSFNISARFVKEEL